MKTLPISAGQEQIEALVIEWNELLAQEKYVEAMSLILYDNTQEIDGKPWIWTPEKLEAAVFTYGQPWYTKQEMEQLYGPDWPDYKVTSLLNSTNSDKLLQDIRIEINLFDSVISPEQAKMWGIDKLDFENIIGDVYYDGMPFNDERSDLTAIFWIKKVDKQNVTLLFRDLHMM